MWPTEVDQPAHPKLSIMHTVRTDKKCVDAQAHILSSLATYAVRPFLFGASHIKC